jgi:hypothetical protein
MGQVIMKYENDVAALTVALSSASQTITKQYNASAIAGLSGSLTSSKVNAAVSYLAAASTAVTAEIGTKVQTGQWHQGPDRPAPFDGCL